MATKKVKRFEQGGIAEAEDKARGLKASKDEKVGFFERLRMGNIDEEGSEAYRRFGAGRGRNNSENTPAKEPAQYRADPYGDMTQAERDARLTIDEVKAQNRAKEQGKPQSSGDASVAEMYQGPRTKPIERTPSASKPSKTESKPASVKTSAYPMTKAQPTTKTYDRSGGPKADELANYKTPTKPSKTPGNYGPNDIPLDSPRAPVKGEKVDSTELSRNVSNALNATPGVQVVGRIAGAGKAAQKAAGSRELAKAAEDSVTYLGKSGRRQVGGFDEISGPASKAIADGTRKSIAGGANQKSLPTPTKKLGYDKAGTLAKRRSERAAKRRDEMLEENAKNYGLDPKATGYESASKAVRKEMGGKDFTFKKGGKVQASKMSSGGSVSPASKRGDGIATRGKTRCKIC